MQEPRLPVPQEGSPTDFSRRRSASTPLTKSPCTTTSWPQWFTLYHYCTPSGFVCQEVCVVSGNFIGKRPTSADFSLLIPGSRPAYPLTRVANGSQAKYHPRTKNPVASIRGTGYGGVFAGSKSCWESEGDLSPAFLSLNVRTKHSWQCQAWRRGDGALRSRPGQ